MNRTGTSVFTMLMREEMRIPLAFATVKPTQEQPKP